MNPAEPNTVPASQSRLLRWLEPITAGVLLVVLVALGAIVALSLGGTDTETTVPDWQLIALTLLLLAALGLVSVVSLLHTRR